MTPTDKWSAHFDYADPAIALLMLVFGVLLFVSEKKSAQLRQARVIKGELSEIEAAKKAKVSKWSSLALVGIGACLMIMWLSGA